MACLGRFTVAENCDSCQERGGKKQLIHNVPLLGIVFLQLNHDWPFTKDSILPTGHGILLILSAAQIELKRE
jgi:hypothetical protein